MTDKRIPRWKLAASRYFAANRLWLVPFGVALATVLGALFGEALLVDDGTPPPAIVLFVNGIGELLLKAGIVLILCYSGLGAIATKTASARVYRVALVVGTIAATCAAVVSHRGAV